VNLRRDHSGSRRSDALLSLKPCGPMPCLGGCQAASAVGSFAARPPASVVAPVSAARRGPACFSLGVMIVSDQSSGQND
jgi:hypothetical protein